MLLEERIDLLCRLAERLDTDNPNWAKAMLEAEAENPWFTQANIQKTVDRIKQEFLSKEKLLAWADSYDLHNAIGNKMIAQVLAGNIPLVGFHDLLAVFISNNKSQLKLSSKDEKLMTALAEEFFQLDARTKDYIQIVVRLENFDAVIATGSNNSARYFNSYFSKYPHIIRMNRNAVAVLNNSTSDEEILQLGNDVFEYFGLGCRNVSKLYLAKDFRPQRLLEVWENHFDEWSNHNKYKNNFEYNYAIYLLNNEKFLTNNIIVLKESPEIASRIACVNYEFYHDIEELEKELILKQEEIQCVVSNLNFNHIDTIPFGSSQVPGLQDYADGVDTLQFMRSL